MSISIKTCTWSEKKSIKELPWRWQHLAPWLSMQPYPEFPSNMLCVTVVYRKKDFANFSSGFNETNENNCIMHDLSLASTTTQLLTASAKQRSAGVCSVSVAVTLAASQWASPHLPWMRGGGKQNAKVIHTGTNFNWIILTSNVRGAFFPSSRNSSTISMKVHHKLSTGENLTCNTVPCKHMVQQIMPLTNIGMCFWWWKWNMFWINSDKLKKL